MSTGGVALTCAGCIAAVHAVIALAADDFYAWAWEAPWAVLLASVVAWLACFAVGITPEQRRDTTAKAHPLTLGVVQVNVLVVESPAALPAGAWAPRARRAPSGGLPPVVDGQVIEQDDETVRERTGRDDDE